MKTKDFIKLLQKEDPTGESHIRINGDVIIGVQAKDGYWDGPYNYFKKDRDGKPTWVASTRGSKIDVMTIDLFDFADMYKGNWEEMKKHIIVEYDYVSKEYENNFIKNAKEQCDEYNEIMEKLKDK